MPRWFLCPDEYGRAQLGKNKASGGGTLSKDNNQLNDGSGNDLIYPRVASGGGTLSKDNSQLNDGSGDDLIYPRVYVLI
jgi:hypothetical protein